MFNLRKKIHQKMLMQLDWENHRGSIKGSEKASKNQEAVTRSIKSFIIDQIKKTQEPDGQPDWMLDVSSLS